ncbi:hypothetical protein SAMN04487762_2233 [Polaribacter sp. Hel1_33_78]|jgi:hypothetical protein|uniref:hypothetical protein n=1 Tax=unclassified Polaribacter TaxID=196858 RepID=UPI00052BE0E4|nr:MULTISPECIES: hypothetical protein [unclassified Polaribacter]MBT7815892.1 hypothetical protein [Polaribacter sp.]MDG1508805.1 hypothetical protein [Flavobacteriaceae bacterium]KGL59757.1 hypothetical protein PHEL49_0618 [Polaribacter sp. Hel1_33_49]MDG2435788.1 hypothetical protein [Polaribacter sp.]PKV64251.1 hypothetical protein ATE90_0631 [Polaribacter sp. Hel1_33_96]
MTITETSQFFEKLLKQTDRKREIRVYKGYITILTNLKNRDLSKGQISLIEDELKSFKLKSNAKNKRRYYSKKLQILKQFLKDKFSLISEGYYTAIGMSLGMCFGVAIGTTFGASGNSIGLALGMFIGLVIGRYKDMEAEKENRVLKTKGSSL